MKNLTIGTAALWLVLNLVLAYLGSPRNSAADGEFKRAEAPIEAGSGAAPAAGSAAPAEKVEAPAAPAAGSGTAPAGSGTAPAGSGSGAK
jgi:hypothetical protein